jgi:hypothetical protein
VVWILLIAGFFNGLLAGVSFDLSVVKLRTRHRIGNILYAQFAKGNDLGNGLFIYPFLAISSGVTVALLTAMVFQNKLYEGVRIQCLFACLTTAIHFIASAFAAPLMLSIRHKPSEEQVLKEIFNRFERWSLLRTVFQILTFLILLWIMVIVETQSLPLQ